MKEDKNKYINDILGIEVTKPDRWTFIPGTWLDHSKERLSVYKELNENGMNPNPLVFGMMYQSEALDIYPTVQCRLSRNDGRNFKEIKKEIFDYLNQVFHRIEIIEDTDDYILSKKLCSSTKFNIITLDSSGEQLIFQAQQIVVTYSEYFLMFSFSGPMNGPYSSEDDFISIIRSIKLR